MSPKNNSVDFHLTSEGHKVLEDVKAKGKSEKKGEGFGSWPPGRGPSICSICCGWCCGPNPYKGGKGKHEYEEHTEDLNMLEIKKSRGCSKVFSLY